MLRLLSAYIKQERSARMKISARNQFEGTISSVVEGSVNGVVTIDFEGYAIKADITMESIKGLELAEGKKGIRHHQGFQRDVRRRQRAHQEHFRAQPARGHHHFH